LPIFSSVKERSPPAGNEGKQQGLDSSFDDFQKPQLQLYIQSFETNLRCSPASELHRVVASCSKRW